MVKTRHKETRKRRHHEVSSSEDSDDSDNDPSTHKSPRVYFHHSCVQSSTAPAHRDDDKIGIPDEGEMNRNLKALQWKCDCSKSSNCGIDDREDGFKELTQELNKEKGLAEPVQQNLGNIFETFWQNPFWAILVKKWKIKNMKTYARP